MTARPSDAARDALPDLTRHATEVAAQLLGCELWKDGVGVRLTEVEAYEGLDDPASHAWRGPTARNRVMFGPAGHLYVYSMHGHACCNIVCGPEGVATAVLVRAGEVVGDLAEARRRRPHVRDAWLARGPGNLARTLGITRADDSSSLLDGGTLQLHPGPAPVLIASGPRVNVSRAADRSWRFWVPGSPTVSAYKPHAALRPTAARTAGEKAAAQTAP